MQKLFDGKKANIVGALESRLDRVVFLGGLAGAPRVARQLISHGHIMVNGRKVTIPSFRVRIHDVISIRPESRDLKVFEGLTEKIKKVNLPEWLKLDEKELKVECIKEPNGEDVHLSFDLNAVGQYYSR